MKKITTVYPYDGTHHILSSEAVLDLVLGVAIATSAYIGTIFLFSQQWVLQFMGLFFIGLIYLPLKEILPDLHLIYKTNIHRGFLWLVIILLIIVILIYVIGFYKIISQ